MSFDLNKLVQPECGGANPLVATARQIASRGPSTSTFNTQPGLNHATQRQINRGQKTANFSNEFLGQIQKLQLSSNHQQSSVSSSIAGQQVANTLTNVSQIYSPSTLSSASVAPSLAGPAAYSAANFNYNQIPSQFQMSSMFETQLETKYRNDILSSLVPTTSKKSEYKLEAPSYTNKTIEPSTIESHSDDKTSTTTATETEKTKEKVDDVEFWQTLSQGYVGPPTFVAPSELEYVFDERNPLKDKFEDPFAEGLKKLEQGDIPSAALLFEAAVLKEPENATAWRYLGTTQAQNEKDTSAIRALKKCLKLDANDQEARLAISVSLANENFKNEASHYLLEWLVNNDKYKTIQANLEEFSRLTNQGTEETERHNINMGQHNYVRDKFVEAARMSPNNPDYEVQSSLGVLFNIQGEYDKAVDCFKAALSVRSNDSLLWNRLGATLANGNKSDEAVIAYRKALELSPGFLRSRYNLAIALIHLNTYDEAAKQLVQVLNMQAAGKGSKNVLIRTRSITSKAIWNTLRTVATLMNRPGLYSMIDGRNLEECNKVLLQGVSSSRPPTENTTSSN